VRAWLSYSKHPVKVALFWDNAGWHKGSVVQEYIKKDGNITVIHFPTYAPEENPQEHVWKSPRSMEEPAIR
jgi:transposase